MYSRDGCDPAFWESFKTAKLDDMPKELKDAYLATAPQPENLQSFFDKCVKRMLEFKGWTSEEIQSIKVPVLILQGDRDIVRPEHAVSMYRLLPKAELSILPGTDHMAVVNRADLIIPIVESFLDSNDQ
ncbi:MAG TPA: alpha/beta hydrolase, partial [Acidobacteriota bacterium]|nr:alpha/beta hydrolase [Acidobacteriota bacterium]